MIEKFEKSPEKRTLSMGAAEFASDIKPQKFDKANFGLKPKLRKKKCLISKKRQVASGFEEARRKARDMNSYRQRMVHNENQRRLSENKMKQANLKVKERCLQVIEQT